MSNKLMRGFCENDARTVAPGRAVAYHNEPIAKPETRAENPEHDSLYQRFEQLDDLLKRATDTNATFLDTIRAARDARALAKLIREQVLK